MNTTLIMASGRVFAEDAAGGVRLLSAGDVLAPGEVVQTGPASAARLQVEGEGSVTLGAGEHWNPADGPPAGEMYEGVARSAPLDTETFATDIEGVGPLEPVLARLLATPGPEGESFPASDGPELLPESSSPGDWLAEAEGALRALARMHPDHPALSDSGQAVAELAGWREGTPFPEAALLTVYRALDAAAQSAFEQYARGAGEALRGMSRGDEVLQPGRFEGAVAEVESPRVEGVAAMALPTEAEAEATGEVLALESLLEDVAVGALGDLLQVEGLPGAARVSLADAGGREPATLWLEDPVGAVGSVLGFDAPEFAFAGSDAY